MLQSELQMKKSISPHPLEKYMKWNLAPKVKTYHNSINNPDYPKKKVKCPSVSRVTFTVIGNRVTKEFLECCEWLTALRTYRSDSFDAPIIRGLTQLEWQLASHDLKLKYGGNAFCSKKKVAVLIGKEFLGDEEVLIKLLKKKYVYHVSINYRKRGIEQFIKFIKNSGRQFAYMHIMIDDKYSGTLTFMLYSDLVPLTCDNFLRLCGKRRGGYAGTSVHRIVKDGWVQCGGYGLKHVALPCENYTVPHDKRGILCMANDGRYCDNSTQFFITLNPAHWMDQKYVAFGQLVDGDDTLKKLENVPTRHESPTPKITICKAEILDGEPQNLSPCPKVVDYLDKHMVNVTQLAIGIIDEVIDTVDFGFECEEASVEYNEQNQEGDISNRDVEDDHAYEETDVGLLLPSRQASSVTQPQRIFYLPLSDVPYPGECDSDCDLECIQSRCIPQRTRQDKGVAKPTPVTPTTSKISLHASSGSAELKLQDTVEDLDSKDDVEIQEYLRLNADRVSFAGSVIRMMARNLAQTNLLANLSFPRNSAILVESEHVKIRTRPTGVVIIAPLGRKESDSSSRSSGRRIGADADTGLHGGLVGIGQLASAIDLQDVKKSVRIASWIMSRTRQPSYPDRRPTGYVRPIAADAADGDPAAAEGEAPSAEAARRPSALSPLLERSSGGIEAPRLKDYYKTISSLAHKNFFLTSSTMNRRSDLSNSPHEKLLRGPSLATKTDLSPDNLLTLRHGPRLMRRYSSDYVHSRFMIEKANQRKLSMRTMEFAKKWPSVSVDEYKRRSTINKDKESHKTIEQSIERAIDLHKKLGQPSLLAGGVGVRLPGDSPAYSWMDDSSQDLSSNSA